MSAFEKSEVEEAEFFKRIAAYKEQGIEEGVIARGLGLTLTELVNLMEMEEFKTIEAEYLIELSQRQQNTSSGWDGLESIAVKNLSEIVQHNRNPEFLLKIATAANAAKRRSQKADMADRHLLSADNVRPIQITIPLTFVNRLQLENDEAVQKFRSGAVKDHNRAGAEQIKNLLQIDSDADDGVSAEFNRLV